MSRNPRQVDSRFILILVDVVTAPVVTDEGDLVELLEATARDDDGLVIILTGDWIYTLTAELKLLSLAVGLDG